MQKKLFPLLLLFLASCSAYSPPSSIVRQPVSALPPPSNVVPTDYSGSIFALASSKSNALFSDDRPKAVGDILTVIISDQSSASNNATNTANRSSSFELESQLQGPGARFINRLGGEASTKSDSSGTGTSSANSNFSANITTTVVQVLTNGNLRIAGEKQIRINDEVQFLRLSGVVNPKDISYNQQVGTLAVDSRKLADARIEHVNKGSNTVYTGKGWLTQLLNFLNPF